MRFFTQTILIASLFSSSLLAQPGDTDGFKTEKHPNGQKAAAGYYVKGKKDGFWKYWSEDGKLRKTEMYRKGLLNGWYRLYFANDSTAEEMFYANGELDSSYKEFNDAGSLLVSGHYKSGKKTGEWNHYLRNTTINGVNMNWGGQNGSQARPAPPKLPLVKTENYREGLLHGTYIENDAWGRVTLRGQYTNGKKDGKFEKIYESLVQWFSRDSLVREKKAKDGGMEESELKNGQKHGEYKYYKPANVLRIEGRYRNNIRHGKFTEYRADGSKWLEYTYVDGTLHGEKREFDAAGKLSLVCRLNNGIFDSLYTTFYPKGTVKEQWRCVKGDFEGAFTAHHPNGRLAETGMYRNDMREGIFTSYDTLGNKMGVVQYHEGMKNGTYTEWYSSGSAKKMELKFVDDSLAGAPKFWSKEGRMLRGPQLGGIYELNGSYANYYGYAMPDTLTEIFDQMRFIFSLPLENRNENVKPARYAKGDKGLVSDLARVLLPYANNYYYGSGIVVLTFDVTEKGVMENLKVYKAYDRKSIYNYNAQSFSQNILAAMNTLLNEKWIPAEENGQKRKSREILVIKSK
ncbi:MAG: MORN repeat-containing protein [Bacteroidetes bacterium]|nr:MAG: MORN repeat-containing protein [Bacteroidota bacterium]